METFESEIERMIASIEASPSSNDPQSLYDLSMLHHDLSMRRNSWDHFAKAEALLREAARKGSSAAAEMLSNWETLRYALGRRISRGPAA